MTTEQLAQIEKALDANDILIAQEALRIARDEIARLREELDNCSEVLSESVDDIDELRADVRKLREALERKNQGLRNILEFRRLENGRYGNLTKHEIECAIAEADVALADTAKWEQRP